MPASFLIPLALSAASAGANYLGWRNSRPRRPNYNPEAILSGQREAAFRDANSATANAGMQLGPQLASQGLQHSGIGLGALSDIAARNNQAALSSIAQQRGPLYARQAELNNEYDQQRQNWKLGGWQILADMLGQAGAGIETSRQNQLYNALLSRTYGAVAGMQPSVTNDLTNVSRGTIPHDNQSVGEDNVDLDTDLLLRAFGIQGRRGMVEPMRRY